MTLWQNIGLFALALLPGMLLAAMVVACCFRRGRRIVAWLIVGAVLLASGFRLAREVRNLVQGRGWGALERAGWRHLAEPCPAGREGWSRTYEIGAAGMSRGWAGLLSASYAQDVPEPFRGKLHLEWIDAEGRTVRESFAGAEGPEGLAFSAGGPSAWMLPLERFDATWAAEREAAGGLKLRVTLVEPDRSSRGEEGRKDLYFCIRMEK